MAEYCALWKTIFWTCMHNMYCTSWKNIGSHPFSRSQITITLIPRQEKHLNFFSPTPFPCQHFSYSHLPDKHFPWQQCQALCCQVNWVSGKQTDILDKYHVMVCSLWEDYEWKSWNFFLTCSSLYYVTSDEKGLVLWRVASMNRNSQIAPGPDLAKGPGEFWKKLVIFHFIKI